MRSAGLRGRRSPNWPTHAGPPPASRLDAHEAFVVGLIEERKGIMLNEMVERLVAEQCAVQPQRLSAWLRGHGGPFKNVWLARRQEIYF